MSKAAELSGKKMIHPTLGKVRVKGPEKGSRTKVVVQEIDRGPGWNPLKERYTGVKRPGSWSRGQNYTFGNQDVVHIQTLAEIVEPENA